MTATTSWLMALFGGALIGAASSILMLADGKIAGISGILGGTLRDGVRREPWRAFFLLGLLVGGALLRVIEPDLLASGVSRSTPAILLAGALVGLGTQIGSGCTSGHGVCGIGRGSPRSIVAVAVFMSTGALTVFVIRSLWGGAV